jgi:hypothetical protein
MEKWDEKIRENLHGSAYLRTYDELPYPLKTVIVESIYETLKNKPIKAINKLKHNK